MTIQEAKFILQAYRPNGEDATDPQFAEALDLAKRDPELGKWFAEQIAFDGAASRALKEVKPPAHLRESILAGQRMIEPEFWWKRLAVWAMAALFAILLGLGGLWLKNSGSADFARFREKMMLTADSTDMSVHIDPETKGAENIRGWLAGKGVETNYVMPAGLRTSTDRVGCQVLDWNGTKATMICYLLHGTNHVDLFIAERSAFKGNVPGSTPQFATEGGDTTASWSSSDKVYMLVGHGNVNEKLLREYIEPGHVAFWPDGALVVKWSERSGVDFMRPKLFRAFRWNKCEVAASDSRRASGGWTAFPGVAITETLNK